MHESTAVLISAKAVRELGSTEARTILKRLNRKSLKL